MRRKFITSLFLLSILSFAVCKIYAWPPKPTAVIYPAEQWIEAGSGDRAEFDGRASTSRDPNGSIVDYSWTWPEGASDIEENSQASCKFAQPDTYIVRLKVKDNTGVWSDEVSATVYATAHPTGISSTDKYCVAADYGAHYRHDFTSSSGDTSDLWNVQISETVTVASDPFNTGYPGETPGDHVTFLDDTGRMITDDEIETPSEYVDVNDFLPKPPKEGLPQTMDTPQTLCWWSTYRAWVDFVDVGITATLSQAGEDDFRFTTIDNNQSCEEPYSGPDYTP